MCSFFVNSIFGGFWGLLMPHITMLIDTDFVYILFEICMGFFSTLFNDIAQKTLCRKMYQGCIFHKKIEICHMIDHS